MSSNSALSSAVPVSRSGMISNCYIVSERGDTHVMDIGTYDKLLSRGF